MPTGQASPTKNPRRPRSRSTIIALPATQDASEADNIVSLTSLTVSDNSAGYKGGGLWTGPSFPILEGNSVPLVRNSIFGNNSSPAAAQGHDVFGTVNSQGFNLIRIADGSSGWQTNPHGPENDRTGTNALPLEVGLDPNGLTANGGFTNTLRLAAGSPALRTGDQSLAETTDQRGYVRQANQVSVGAYDPDGVDANAPVVQLNSWANDPVSGVFSVMATFSEPVANFTLAGVLVTNGSAGNFQEVMAGIVYTLDILPTTDGLVTVSVEQGVAQDYANNDNEAAEPLTRFFDGTAASVSLSTQAADPFYEAWFTVTVNFSEVVTGFALDGVSINNGTASNLQEMTAGIEYAFDVTPTAYGLVSVDVSEGTTHDLAGNASAATSTLSVFFGGAPPIVNDDTFSIDENSAYGTVVGGVTASDPDAGQSLSYVIVDGNINDAFAIDGLTGQITVNNSAAMDFETYPTFSLTVQVTDNSDPALCTTATITVNLNDVNESPTAADAAFSVDENSPNGMVVGNVTAGDVDAGQSLTFSIIDGNTGDAFAIDPQTGQIWVNNSAALDFETTPVLTLSVQMMDNGEPALSTTTNITINLNEVNEAPTANDDTFYVDENSSYGTLVGGVTASDVDAGASLSYAIIDGNTNDAFAIDVQTGQIWVNNPAALDFESNPTFVLTVQVTDSGYLTANSTITINLNDVNEAPTANGDAFYLDENSAYGTVVCSATIGFPH